MIMAYKVSTVKRMAQEAVAALSDVSGRGAQRTRCSNILRMVTGHKRDADIFLSLEDYNALTLLPED